MASLGLEHIQKLEAHYLGPHCPYEETIAFMNKLHGEIANNQRCSKLLLLQHEPVITLTRQHQDKSIKTSRQKIEMDQIKLAMADRGGDVTFHGPGQIVGYLLIKLHENPIEALAHSQNFIRNLERALLKTVLDLGLWAKIFPGFTGVWVKHENKIKKLIAIGISIQNGVSKHGFAFNYDIDLDPFTKHIVPCGLKNHTVVSLKECFDEKHLLMPNIYVMVEMLAKNIAQQFSLGLKLEPFET